MNLFRSFCQIAGDRQGELEDAALALARCDVKVAAMAQRNVLDDGQSKAGAAAGAALLHTYPVEPFRQAGQMLGIDAGPIIGYGSSSIRCRCLVS